MQVGDMVWRKDIPEGAVYETGFGSRWKVIKKGELITALKGTLKGKEVSMRAFYPGEIKDHLFAGKACRRS